MKDGVNVQLNTDLTNYSKGLVVGVKGITCAPRTQWGKSFGIGVEFETGEFLDVLESGLDVLDEGYWEQIAKEKEEYLESLKEATDIEVTYGPRGGFKYLSYRINHKGFHGIGFKQSAEEHLEAFRKAGLYIKTI